jgi:iron complex outermembrane receptor protein
MAHPPGGSARGIRAPPERRCRVRAAGCLTVLGLAVLLQPSPALAQADAGAPPAQTETVLPPVEVIAATPLLGSGVDRDKVPAETRVLTDRDITRDGNADALRALNELVPGVTLDSASGNPFQSTLLYHGFQASPLQGTPQGLAVYVNGARFN